MSKNIHVHDKTLLYFLTDVHMYMKKVHIHNIEGGGVLLT